MASYRFDGRVLTERGGRKVGELRGNDIYDRRNSRIGKIDGQEIRDRSNRRVAKFDGRYVRDSGNSRIARIEDVNKAIDGVGGECLWLPCGCFFCEVNV